MHAPAGIFRESERANGGSIPRTPSDDPGGTDPVRRRIVRPEPRHAGKPLRRVVGKVQRAEEFKDAGSPSLPGGSPSPVRGEGHDAGPDAVRGAANAGGEESGGKSRRRTGERRAARGGDPSGRHTATIAWRGQVFTQAPHWRQCSCTMRNGLPDTIECWGQEERQVPQRVHVSPMR